MKKFILTISCALSMIVAVFAQEAKPQMFLIREHFVKPAMNAEYEAGIRKLKEACALHKVNTGWTTILDDDNSYVHLHPINGLGDVEERPLSELRMKMGHEPFAALMSDITRCMDGFSTVVSTLLPSLSYLNPAEGENYLDVLFLTPLPGKHMELETVFAEWKKTYVARKVPAGYQIFRTMFGVDPGYVIVLSAKNPTDMAAKTNKTYELAGEEISKLWQKQISLCKKYDWKRGTIRPELGYRFTAAN